MLFELTTNCMSMLTMKRQTCLCVSGFASVHVRAYFAIMKPVVVGTPPVSVIEMK